MLSTSSVTVCAPSFTHNAVSSLSHVSLTLNSGFQRHYWVLFLLLWSWLHRLTEVQKFDLDVLRNVAGPYESCFVSRLVKISMFISISMQWVVRHLNRSPHVLPLFRTTLMINRPKQSISVDQKGGWVKWTREGLRDSRFSSPFPAFCAGPLMLLNGLPALKNPLWTSDFCKDPPRPRIVKTGIVFYYQMGYCMVGVKDKGVCCTWFKVVCHSQSASYSNKILLGLKLWRKGREATSCR